MTIIILILIWVAFASWRTLPSKYYAISLYAIGAALILMNTLVSPYIVGSDVHMEYYIAQRYSGADVWPRTLPSPQATSIVDSVLVPLLPISLTWTYKLVLPLLFALTPVLLYYMARKWLEPKRAFLASFIFMAFTSFFMEVPTIARQMVAEVVFVSALYLIFKSTSRHRYYLLLACGALLPLCHYAVAAVAVPLLLIAIFLDLVLKQKQWKALTILLAGIIIASIAYFPFAEEGAVAQKFAYLYNTFAPPFLKISFGLAPEVVDNSLAAQVVGPASWYDTLMRIGMGADFLSTNWVGKAFRLFQWAFMLLIPIGMLRLRKVKSLLPILVGFAISLAMCIIPGWAGMLNITRYFHLTLIGLAIPAAVALKPKYLLIILVPYFLLSSGFAFEVTKQPNIETVTAPYSIGLSNYRMDLGASTTKGDLEVRDYIVEHQLFPIYSDVYGSYLIEETIGPQFPEGNVNQVLPKTPEPTTGYVFIRSRNSQDGTLTIWQDIGMRTYRPFNDYLKTRATTIFESKGAKVIYVYKE